MTSSQKSTFAAVGVFVLIGIVLLGGMAWATAASLELAKKTASGEYLTRVHRALWRLESEMKGILNSEASRPYTDYVDLHMVQPVSALTGDGREIEVARVLLRSPIAMSGPPYDWIDLYFQIDEDGVPSSPQFGDESSLWIAETDPITDSNRRAREAWGWFKRTLPTMDLRNQVSEALKKERSMHGSATEPEPQQVVRVAQRPASLRGAGRADGSSSRPPRRASIGSSGVGYVPGEVCLTPAQDAPGEDSDVAVAIDSGFEVTALPPAPTLISLSPFAPPFWIDVGSDQPKKMAFVREGSSDAEVFYQGFVGDWEKLKTELLRSIADMFPAATLEFVANDRVLDAADSDMKLHELPALLRVPDVPLELDEAAWRSMRGVFLVTWSAAAAVLIVAGWGVRNLMALTARRMQFAYAVTHELRTPLTTFRLYSDMLSAGLVSEESKQEYLDTLNRESQRLSSLVEAVLEYARLENQKVKLHLATTDAVTLLRVVGETVEKRCVPNAVEGETRNNVQGAHPINTDISLVNQIAAVLVDNACRHARGSPKPKVIVQLSGDNGRLFLDVMDSGPGVDLRDSHTIFKPFRRGRDADAAARGGIGLGLSLARNWATLLGGRLDLVARHHPQYGGAHFRLSIPSEAPVS